MGFIGRPKQISSNLAHCSFVSFSQEEKTVWHETVQEYRESEIGEERGKKNLLPLKLFPVSK